MKWLGLRECLQLDRESASPPAKCGVVRHGQIDLQQKEQRVDKSLSLAQWQVIDFAHKQGAADGSISIDQGATAPGSLVRVEPAVNGVSIKPERDASSRDEGGGILAMVTDAVLGFGGLCHGRLSLSASLHPSTFMQQSRKAV